MKKGKKMMIPQMHSYHGTLLNVNSQIVLVEGEEHGLQDGRRHVLLIILTKIWMM